MSKIALKAAALVASLSLLDAPAAHAQDIASLSSQGSSSVPVGTFLGLNEQQAWDTRNRMLRDIENLNNPQAAAVLAPAVDNAVNAVFPGLIARKNAEIRAREEAEARARAEQVAREKAAAEAAARKAEEERRRNSFNPGPCPADADVCVDIDGRRTWLQDDAGRPYYIASAMAPGRPGEDTPRGTFYVTRQVKDEISREFGNAPMPYATYFTNNGHAFHQGNPAYDSAGCVRLPQQDAIRYFNDLKPGDKVFIY